MLVPQPPPSEKTDLDKLIAKLEGIRGHRALVYWTRDMAKISPAAEVPLYDQLREMGQQDDLDLILFTRGGDTEAPNRIVSMIREYCKRLHILIPYRCSSAGTLIAMGADTIVMTPLAFLGPIDPSRTHPLLPKRAEASEPEPISVQDMRHAMQFIQESAVPIGEPRRGFFRRRRVQTTGYTPDAMAQIFSALFDKIHPLAIGAIEQSYALAKLVGRKCLAMHMDDEGEINRIVDTLCDDYKSHSYQIGRNEAREIGLNVLDATDEEEQALLDLARFYEGRIASPSLQPGMVGQMFIAWIDTAHRKMRVRGTYEIESDGKVTNKGDHWESY